VPVQSLLDFREAGATLDEFIQSFLRVQREQAVRFLETARD
jgi:hypothetical protein